MKIEANPSPEHIKWFVLAIMIVVGIGHKEIMILMGV